MRNLDGLRHLRMRAEEMFLEKPGRVIQAFEENCNLSKITKKDLIDVDKIVNELFDLHACDGRFRNVVGVIVSAAGAGAHFDAVAEVQAWLELRRERGISEELPLFCHIYIWTGRASPLTRCATQFDG